MAWQSWQLGDAVVLLIERYGQLIYVSFVL